MTYTDHFVPLYVMFYIRYIFIGYKLHTGIGCIILLG